MCSGSEKRCGLSKHVASDTIEPVAGKSAAGKTAAAAKGGKNSAKVQSPKCMSLSLYLSYPPCIVVRYCYIAVGLHLEVPHMQTKSVITYSLA